MAVDVHRIDYVYISSGYNNIRIEKPEQYKRIDLIMVDSREEGPSVQVKATFSFPEAKQIYEALGHFLGVDPNG